MIGERFDLLALLIRVKFNNINLAQWVGSVMGFVSFKMYINKMLKCMRNVMENIEDVVISHWPNVILCHCMLKRKLQHPGGSE